MTRKKKLINFGVSPVLTINNVREKRSNVAQNLRRIELVRLIIKMYLQLLADLAKNTVAQLVHHTLYLA